MPMAISGLGQTYGARRAASVEPTSAICHRPLACKSS